MIDTFGLVNAQAWRRQRFRWARGAFAAVALLLVPTVAAAEAYEQVGFDRLAAFKFVPPEPTMDGSEPKGGEEQIPADIKALSGRKLTITGYMLPVRLAQGRATEFLLVKDPSMCCYGVVPEMNEWVVVKMNGGGVAPVMDVPVSFYGEFKVGATFENGYMTGIYELAGEGMAKLEK